MVNVFFFDDLELGEQLACLPLSSPLRILKARSPQVLTDAAFSRIHDIFCICPEVIESAGLSLEELCLRMKPALVFLRVPPEEQQHYVAYCKVWEHVHVISAQISPELLAESLLRTWREKEILDHLRFREGILPDPLDLTLLATRNAAMAEVVDRVKDIALTDATVLLSGETGTGKEVLANIIHTTSKRRNGPFMAVNCGALPDSLLESELFGHEKGSFSGALFQRIGKIESADGGTLFLDELESMSEAMQVRLLRILQEKSLHRLGSNREIKVDFRLIAATNIDPAELLDSGRLRSDLYYRLALFPMHLPPLRERVEDIPLLAMHFFNRKKKQIRDYVKRIHPDAMALLCSVPWPGNIRELQNTIERALLLAGDEEIALEHLHLAPQHFPVAEAVDVSYQRAFRPGITLKAYKSRQTQVAEQHYLAQLLEYTGGRIGESARFAGLSPRALYNKMRIHGLRKEDYRQSVDEVPIGKTTEIHLQ